MHNNVPSIRQLNIGQLLDQAIRLYRRNFGKFIGIIAIVQIPLTILGLLVSFVSSRGGTLLLDPYDLGPYLLSFGGTLLQGLISAILIRGVATAALTQAVADQYLGEPTSVFDAYRRIGSTWKSLIAAVLLSILINIGLGIWTIVPCIGWITGIGILMFYSLVILPLIAPAVVLERQRAGGAIRRAWDLARREFWWVVGFVAILYLLQMLVVQGPAAILSGVLSVAAEGWLGDFSTAFIARTVIQSLVTLFLSLIYLPLELSAITLLYFDLRVRTEGFDLALLAASALEDRLEPAAVLSQAPPPENKGLVTWQEIGYFALLSIGTFVLIGALYAILMAVVYAIVGL